MQGGVSPALAWSRLALLAFCGLFAAVLVMQPHHGLEGLAHYLPLHTFVETVSIVFAALVFGVVWHGYSRERPAGVVLLGCALLAIAFIDFAHALSYEGMPDFVTPASAEKAIFFWLAARLVSALALLAAALLPRRPLESARARYALLGAAAVLVLSVYWIGLFQASRLPRMFVPETGLTSAKLGTEYAIIALFAVSAALFHARARRTGATTDAVLFAAAAVSVLSELCFTLYSSVTDVFNLIGHGYKVAAYALVYSSVFVESVREPFEALREGRHRLALLTDNVPAMIAYVDADRRFRYANPRYRMFYGGSDAPLEGRRLEEVLTPQARDAMRTHVEQALRGEALTYEGERRLHDGAVRHVSVSLVPDRGESGVVRGLYILALDVTAQHQAETALRESEAGLRHAQDMAHLAHVIVSAEGYYERWSEGWPRLLGLEASKVPRTTREALALVHPEDRARFRAASIEAGRSRRRMVLDYRMRRGDGAIVDVHQSMEPLGEVVAPEGRSPWFVTLQDVTEQKLAEDRIRRLNRIHAVLSGINAAIVRIRERQELFEETCRIAVEAGRFRIAWIGLVDPKAQRVRVAASAGDVGGYFETLPPSILETKPGGDSLVSRAVREKRPAVSNDVGSDPLRTRRPALLERDIEAVAAIPLLVGGEAVGVLVFLATERGFFDDQEMRLLLELANDVAFALDHIEKEEKVRYLAYYDSLTGLANRTLLLERLAQELSAAAREGERLALLIFNIERFKTINDSFGRQVGDALLREIAERLIELSRDSTHLARVGGDHFAVIVPNVPGEDWLIRRLEEGHRHIDGTPYRAGGLRIATRAGVAVSPGDGTDAETLFRNAEAALKKTPTGEAFLFYAPQMTERVAERLRLENGLRLALEREEFVLHYQPKVDLQNGRLTGLEALLRWRSPERGLVQPREIIPLLEETGLILPVGAWALRRAALDHRDWSAKGLQPPRIAVNVSAIQLRQRDFVARLEQAIDGGIAPSGVDLEITESMVMENVDENIEKLKAARRLGVEVSVDDFGTGHSSLAYLAKLPVQSLKIDRSFVHSMADNSDAMSLVSTIISLAHSLRLKVIAEGVETPVQEQFLTLLRCDEAQGHLFGGPVAASQIEERLRASRRP